MFRFLKPDLICNAQKRAPPPPTTGWGMGEAEEAERKGSGALVSKFAIVCYQHGGDLRQPARGRKRNGGTELGVYMRLLGQFAQLGWCDHYLHSPWNLLWKFRYSSKAFRVRLCLGSGCDNEQSFTAQAGLDQEWFSGVQLLSGYRNISQVRAWTMEWSWRGSAFGSEKTRKETPAIVLWKDPRQWARE